MNRLNFNMTFFKYLAVLCAGAASAALASCDNELDVQQSYEFTVETMPVPKELAKGETAEIRCELKRSGEFADALYTVRYFQYDGEGTLSLDNSLVLLPNGNSDYIIPPDARNLRISWWSWRTTSDSHANWNLTSSMTAVTMLPMRIYQMPIIL